MQLAEDMGIKVERRPIPEEELETFERSWCLWYCRSNQPDSAYR